MQKQLRKQVCHPTTIERMKSTLQHYVATQCFEPQALSPSRVMNYYITLPLLYNSLLHVNLQSVGEKNIKIIFAKPVTS